MNKYEGIFFIVIVIGFFTLMGIQTYFKHEEKMQIVTGGFNPEETIVAETIIHDSLFNHEYSGDTACFKLMNDTTIRLQCVCPCEVFKTTKK